MSIARHHAEWLSLVEVSGPFLSLSVLMQAFPQGLEAHEPEPIRNLRMAYEEWQINQEGRNAFLEYQLPEAVIALKQGAGRLIRDETDRGVLMICDPRLYSKSYGRRILQSLPPMRRTRIEADAVAFFQTRENEVSAVG